jgi:hypothetical protein
MNIELMKKHLAKVGIAGAVVLSVILINQNPILLRFPESYELVHFLFLIAAVLGMFMIYQEKQQPWLLIIGTTLSLFNYFFLFILPGKFMIYLTAVGLIGIFIWNILVDREEGEQGPPSQFK